MQDHRKAILEAGLALLRENGLAALTQPKIAAKTGLRQSHLTYYYPTRADLLAAVARLAIEAQLTAIRSLVKGASSKRKTASTIAAVTVMHENTRVLAALNQAADQEPAVRELFNELLEGFIAELRGLLEKLGCPRMSPTWISSMLSLWGFPSLTLPRRGGRGRRAPKLS
jgi:AcrR family transcriptional regulator